MRDEERLGKAGSENLDAEATLFQSSPCISILFDSNTRIIGNSPGAVRFFGFSSDKDFKEGVRDLIFESIPQYQPSGRESIPLKDRLEEVLKNESFSFTTDLVIRGKNVRLSVLMKRVKFGDSYCVAAYLNERSEHEERFQLMIDRAPFACAYYDTVEQKITDCNIKTVQVLGFPSKEEYLSNSLSILPDDESRLQIRGLIDRTIASGRETFDFVFKHASGEELPLEITAISSQWNRRNVIALYARELKDIRKAEKDSEMRLRLLQSVNDVATVLIEAGPEMFENAINASLKIMGEAAGVDRVYVWENSEKNGKLFCTQRYEWSEKVEAQQGKDFTIELDYDDVPIWKERMLAGKSINGVVGTDVADETGVLAEQGILSILLLPIHVHGKPWGYIGFDDCRSKRVFSAEKEPVLHSAGILIVSSIERNRMTKNIIKATDMLKEQGRLLQAVNITASILLETEQDNFELSVYKALKELGVCAGASAVSIWKNVRGGDGRLGASVLFCWKEGERFSPGTGGGFIDYEHFLPGRFGSGEDLSAPTSDLFAGMWETPLVEGGGLQYLLPLNIGGDFWGAIAFTTKDGANFFEEPQKNILRSGGMLIASAIIRNEIMESLVEARESALASARSKSGFLSRMSHEIRTPINAIIGMTALAKKSGDTEKVKHYLETVDSSSRQLLDIINDVLDMSKIDADKLEIIYREFDFEGMLRRVLNVIQNKMDEKKINFKVDFPRAFSKSIISDDLRLSQVLINLLSNAIKFTGDYGAISLKIRETPSDKHSSLLRMEVSDNGVGIASENLEKIFQLFEQADGGITRQFGGTGLGLAICRHIAELMGGDIWAESMPGSGSRFFVEVPVRWGAPLAESVDYALLKPDLRVLVVDDAPEILEYFEAVLSNFSINCDTAKNGNEAIRLVAEQDAVGKPYDVVFIDWFMPGLNGGETAREVKRIMHDDIVVIMISSAAWSDIEKEASEAGVHYYLPKPVLSSDLYNILIQLTSRQKSTEEPAQEETLGDYRGRHILLVEDNDINREIVEELLEDTGVTIDYAENGLEGVRMFTQNPEKYALILMDIHMPVMDGLTATRNIRASGLPNAASVQIVAMTADAFKEDQQTSADAGMNGHISKPFDTPELFAAVKKALG